MISLALHKLPATNLNWFTESVAKQLLAVCLTCKIGQFHIENYVFDMLLDQLFNYFISDFRYFKVLSLLTRAPVPIVLSPQKINNQYSCSGSA